MSTSARSAKGGAGTATGIESWTEESRAPVRLLEAIAIARRTVAMLTELPIDSVAGCERTAGGGWRIVVDAVEAKARMGDDDLLATHEVILAADGELAGFSRLRRYRREDRTQT
jgi:hypothetical protein